MGQKLSSKLLSTITDWT